MKFLVLISLFISTTCLSQHFKKTYHQLVTSEGQNVYVFHPDLIPFVKEELDLEKLTKLKQMLEKSLEINLTPRGFVQAATRDLKENEKDETNYDAIWVRDNAWVFFYFMETKQEEKARKLILALWDYYSSKDQIQRIFSIIEDPPLAKLGNMNVPHIRFDGNSLDFKDVHIDGELQVWNHRQNDAHGLFLLGLGQAYKNGIISDVDFSKRRSLVLSIFPDYFDAINYQSFHDAGAWEEVNKINTSSVAMVVKALENWRDNPYWKKGQVERLIKKGYQRIHKNLELGGESPDHDPKSLEFRKNDAALFNLFLPMPLQELSKSDKLLGLSLIEKLIRPFGVIRYENDSYQGGNYWIQTSSESTPGLTDDASSDDAFKARLKGLIPNTEAQWFFDSKLSMIYSLMANEADSKREREIYKTYSITHLKRSLGQITGPNALAADGGPVREMEIPESINTVIIDEKAYFVPSPITPLNWAKASLGMAIERIHL